MVENLLQSMQFGLVFLLRTLEGALGVLGVFDKGALWFFGAKN